MPATGTGAGIGDGVGTTTTTITTARIMDGADITEDIMAAITAAAGTTTADRGPWHTATRREGR